MIILRQTKMSAVYQYFHYFKIDFLIINNLEKFWSNSKLLKTKVQDDQVRINYILQESGIQWFVEKDCSDISHCTVTGSTKDGITVTLLSQDIICRQSCQKDHDYYIWHGRAPRSSSSKEAKAREGGVWLLCEDWKRILHSSSATGQNLINKLTK